MEKLDLLRYVRPLPGREMLVRHFLGMYDTDRIDALKGVLDHAGALPADGKLNTVLVQDLDHFGELIVGSLPGEVKVTETTPGYWPIVTAALGLSTLLLLQRNRAHRARVLQP